MCRLDPWICSKQKEEVKSSQSLGTTVASGAANPAISHFAHQLCKKTSNSSRPTTKGTSTSYHRHDVARHWRKVELPVHSASAQHQREQKIPAPVDCEKERKLVSNAGLQVDGKQKVMYALTKIKGVGRRYSNLVCKKADVDLNKRYGCPDVPPSPRCLME